MHFQLYRCSLKTSLKHTGTTVQEARASIASVKRLEPTARSALAGIPKYIITGTTSSLYSIFHS